MRKNRCILIVGLVLGILAGGFRTRAELASADQPPTENPDWIPAEEAAEEPEEELAPPPGDEPPGEPMEEPAGEPLEEPTAEPLEEPTEAPTAVPVEVPVKIPEPPGKTKIPVASQPAKPRGETFRVRLAEAGKGFRQGVAGQLRVTASGLAFTCDGDARANWSIAWKDLQAARKEGGLWDAPFVLGLVERDGRRRYVARLDKDGRYLDGGPILAAIVRTGGAKFK